MAQDVSGDDERVFCLAKDMVESVPLPEPSSTFLRRGTACILVGASDEPVAGAGLRLTCDQQMPVIGRIFVIALCF